MDSKGFLLWTYKVSFYEHKKVTFYGDKEVSLYDGMIFLDVPYN